MDAFAASLECSPELFPLSFDSLAGSVTLIRLTEQDYRAASFLDGRVVTARSIRRAVPWRQLETAVDRTRLQERCSFIFHIGHVGSTLLSRLLGEHPSVFALREPAIFRMLAQVRQEIAAGRAAETMPGDRLLPFLKLWSRTFRPQQRACIKATSFVSELAGEILMRPFQPKAVFVFVPAEPYLATILGGPNSRQEAAMLAPGRLERLHNRLGEKRWNLTHLTEGEIIAMNWACEMTALCAAAATAGDRVLWWNFDHFLRNPKASLGRALHHLGIPATDAESESLLSGQEMQRYSKAPEYAYDANLRCTVLDRARMEFRDEIVHGMAWLERLSAQSTLVARALKIATG